jgi:signal transduction histidine kinase
MAIPGSMKHINQYQNLESETTRLVGHHTSQKADLLPSQNSLVGCQTMETDTHAQNRPNTSRQLPDQMTDNVVALTVGSVSSFVSKLEHESSTLSQPEASLQRLIENANQKAAIATFAAHLIEQIHHTLHLHTVFEKTASDLRQFLQSDRVIIAQILSDHILHQAEAIEPSWDFSFDWKTAPAACYQPWLESFQQRKTLIIEDLLKQSVLPESMTSLLYGQQVKAAIFVPIMVNEKIWGLLIAHQCDSPRSWDESEVNLLKQLSTHLGIAIGRTELYQHLQQVNIELERKYRLQNAQLQLAFEFEATLKRITDKVRDSLDETQILQGAVQELATTIGVSGCNAALYDLENGTSTICYEYTTTVSPSQGRVAHIKAFPEIYTQLFEGIAFQFCSIVPNPVRGHVSMLACPILDDQGVLGDLWLINHKFYAFSEQDIRLVQQVANQCAIALRQARLYKAAQTQVAELERLNRLKDDFLSTVSHELRTPIASIKMATQMLELTLDKAGLLATSSMPIARYLQILQGECNREINLVNDLLDLSRLEAQVEPVNLCSMSLQDWVSDLVEPFVERTDKQQQQFQVEIPSGVTHFVSDFSKLDRILSELLHNACKYTPPKEWIWLKVKLLGDHIQINVSNSGIEIPAEERSRIFEKFYRIPNVQDPWKHGGTGLGLALVKKLVEQLSGSIEVESGEGITTFIVSIPQKCIA